MSDIAPEIRRLARENAVIYTRHAIERICEYNLTVMQVTTMMKNCNHNHNKSDDGKYRVEGRSPASKTGT